MQEPIEQIDPYANLRALDLINKKDPRVNLVALEKDIQRYQGDLNATTNGLQSYMINFRSALDNVKYYTDTLSNLNSQRRTILNLPAPITDYTADAMQVVGSAINGLSVGLIGRQLLVSNVDHGVIYPFKLTDATVMSNDATIHTSDIYTGQHNISFRFKNLVVIEYGQGMQLAVPMAISLEVAISRHGINLTVEYDTMGTVPHPHVNSTGSICWGDIDHLKNQMVQLDTWIAEYVEALSHVPNPSSRNPVSAEVKREYVIQNIYDIYCDYGASISVVLHTYNASSPYFTYADSLAVLACTVNNLYRGDNADREWYELALKILDTANNGGASKVWDLKSNGFAMVAWTHRAANRYSSIEQALKYIKGESLKSFTSEMGSFIRDSDSIDSFDIEDMFDSSHEYLECDCGYHDEDSDNYEDEHSDDCASHTIDEDSTGYSFNSHGFEQVKLGLTRFKLLLDYLRGNAVYVEPEAIVEDARLYDPEELPILSIPTNNEVQDEDTLF